MYVYVCRLSIFYIRTCDCSTDPITEQVVKVQEKPVIAHAQYAIVTTRKLGE